MTLPIDPDMKTAWEQQRTLQRVKGSFLDGDTSAVVVSLIAEPLARFEENHRMDSSDTQIVQVSECGPSASVGIRTTVPYECTVVLVALFPLPC
jgi:hypothetical protein